MTATVDDQGLAGNCLIARKKQHCLCDIFWFDHAFKQAIVYAVLFAIIWPRSVPGRAHETGRDSIDSDFWRQSVCKVAREVDQSSLARTVGDTAAGYPKAGDRRRTDNSAVCFFQSGGCLLYTSPSPRD